MSKKVVSRKLLNLTGSVAMVREWYDDGSSRLRYMSVDEFFDREPVSLVSGGEDGE